MIKPCQISLISKLSLANFTPPCCTFEAKCFPHIVLWVLFMVSITTQNYFPLSFLPYSGYNMYLRGHSSFHDKNSRYYMSINRIPQKMEFCPPMSCGFLVSKHGWWNWSWRRFTFSLSWSIIIREQHRLWNISGLNTTEGREIKEGLAYDFHTKECSWVERPPNRMWKF